MYSLLFIAEDNSEETSFKCLAQNKPEPSGKFQWTIGGEIVKSASDPDEITATGDEISTFIYTPKVLNTIFFWDPGSGHQIGQPIEACFVCGKPI